MVATGHRVTFSCNGSPVDVDVAAGESLLSVLRERLGIVSAKDGCAPQGQCGCCTVLVDGEPRVACVTPIMRVVGREVTTVEGLDAAVRDGLVDAFTATGASQCGFCTPGILVRAASLQARAKTSRLDADRALAAHLCRCTGWQTIHEALVLASVDPNDEGLSTPRRMEPAARRAELEGGVRQAVGRDVPVGLGGFADDTAPRDALVAVPLPPGSDAPFREAASVRWVVADTLHEARARAGKVQGRRTTLEAQPPIELPPLPTGGVRLATSWVEPAYLEPDASWCEPGGKPTSPLANGGAFGGKELSPVAAAARELADATGRIVRTVFSREDVVRLGPKRPPIAASAVVDGNRIDLLGTVAGSTTAHESPPALPYALTVAPSWTALTVPGPPVAAHDRFVLGDYTVLVEGAISAAGLDRARLVEDERAERVLLATSTRARSGAAAGARVALGADGCLELVQVRVAAGDPLDEVVLRSYAIGAAHMALGWVLTEGIAVARDTGDVLDLTIRSFGVIRAAGTPPIDVQIVDDAGPALARSSDAVFAAVAAATWEAVTAHAGRRPEQFPARGTPAAQHLRV